MIRLTLNANSKPEIHLFNKSIILIGADASQVDLLLVDTVIQPIHLKIIEQSGVFFAINQANDPFVSINNHPFGKKLLQNGDMIQIHQIEIRFENLRDLQSEPSGLDPLSEKKNSEDGHPVAAQTGTKSLLGIDLPFDGEVEALNEEEFQHGNLSKILVEAEPLQEKQTEPPVPHLKLRRAAKNVVGQKSQSSLKDDYLRDLEDDNPEHSDLFVQGSEQSHFNEPN